MKREELEKESEKHCNETLCSVCENPTCTEYLRCREWRDRRAGYYCGAEPREKRIEKLEKENERLTVSYETLKLHDEEEIGMLKSENAELTETINKLREQLSLRYNLEDKITELEQENKTISRKANEAIADKLLITAKYNEVLNDLNKEKDILQKENAELKKLNENNMKSLALIGKKE